MSTKTSALTGRELLAALAVVFIWGINFVITKFALRDFTPFQLGTARFTLALVPFAFFVKPPAVHWKWVTLYGVFQCVGQFSLMFIAIKVGLPTALGSVLLQTQVFFTALFGFVLLRERVSRQLQIGLVLAALGLVCFALNYVQPGARGSTASTPLGFLLILGSAAMWAASNIIARRMQEQYAGYSALAFVVWSSAAAILPFAALSYVFDSEAVRWHWMDAPWTSWLAVVYLSWMATLAGYGLWTALLQRHPVNKVAPFSLGVPIVGLAAGMIVFGEVIAPWQWAGIALLGAALACVMLGGWLKSR
jgi:O-acetylserine/cysteine efflux transporter